MTSKLSKFILFILLLSGVCTGTTYSQICAYSVSGQVTDPVTHLPVSGAGIGLYQSGFSDTVYTDAGGNYNYSYYTSCDSMNVYILTRLLGCQYSSTWLNIPAGDTAYHSFETCVPEPPDTTCSALLSVLNTSGNTISYSWSGNSSPVASVVSVIWSFGDGQTRNGGDSGTYTYPTPGSYTLCATATWASGCVATDCKTVTVGDSTENQCVFEITGQVTDPQTGQPAANEAVEIWNYWAGTQVVSTDSNGVYSFTRLFSCDSLQRFWVRVLNCGSAGYHYAEVLPGQPYNLPLTNCGSGDTCRAQALLTPYGANGTEFDWNGYNSYGLNPISAAWDFGDGHSTTDSDGIHYYDQPGTYTACVTLTWASGCVATDCQTVTVSDSTENQCVFEITGQVTDPQTGQPAVNESVEVWNQGAQNSQFVLTDSNGVYRYTHHFSCDSSQRFWVGVVDCGTNTYHYLEVFPGQPYNRPLITCGSDSSGCGGGTVNVSSIQQGIALSYNVPGANDFIVTFGDGTGTFFSPTQHVYADSGVYEVCVHAYVSNTCSFDTCFTVSINRSTASDSCQGQAMLTPYGTNGVEFGWNGHNTLGLNPVSVTWDFGDGDSSSTTNGGIHYYDQPGTYTACVTLTWGTGCVATDCRNIEVGVTTPEPLCGFVFYSDDSLAASCTRVYLMNMDSTGVHTVADTYTGVDGYYCFYSQPAGTYTVLAIPCDSLTIAENLLPTYLGNVLYWQNALQTSANPLPAIRLIDGQQTQGPGSISGIVVWGDDKAPGDPAVGIRVLLLDGEGNPIGYSVTDAEGFYSFAHLPPGTYRIYPEAAGYMTYPILVTLTAENPDAENLNFGVGFNVFMGIQEAPVSVKGLYPNPASEITTLSFSSKQSGAGELRITDLSGKTVLSRTVNVIQGAQNISVALPQIGAGMYTLTLTLNGQQTHVKLIKQ